MDAFFIIQKLQCFSFTGWPLGCRTQTPGKTSFKPFCPHILSCRLHVQGALHPLSRYLCVVTRMKMSIGFTIPCSPLQDIVTITENEQLHKWNNQSKSSSASVGWDPVSWELNGFCSNNWQQTFRFFSSAVTSKLLLCIIPIADIAIGESLYIFLFVVFSDFNWLSKESPLSTRGSLPAWLLGPGEDPHLPDRDGGLHPYSQHPVLPAMHSGL